jgi:hypothetical protein
VTAAAAVVAVPTDAEADAAAKAELNVAKAAVTEPNAPTNLITVTVNAASVLKDAAAVTTGAIVKTARVKNHGAIQLQSPT